MSNGLEVVPDPDFAEEPKEEPKKKSDEELAVDAEVASLDKEVKRLRLAKERDALALEIEARRAGFLTSDAYLEAIAETKASRERLDRELTLFHAKEQALLQVLTDCNTATEIQAEDRENLYQVGHTAGSVLVAMASAFAKGLQGAEGYHYWRDLWKTCGAGFSEFLAFFRLTEDEMRKFPDGIIPLSELIKRNFDGDYFLQGTGYMEALERLRRHPLRSQHITPQALIALSGAITEPKDEFDESEEQEGEGTEENTTKEGTNE